MPNTQSSGWQGGKNTLPGNTYTDCMSLLLLRSLFPLRLPLLLLLRCVVSPQALDCCCCLITERSCLVNEELAKEPCAAGHLPLQAAPAMHLHTHTLYGAFAWMLLMWRASHLCRAVQPLQHQDVAAAAAACDVENAAAPTPTPLLLLQPVMQSWVAHDDS